MWVEEGLGVGHELLKQRWCYWNLIRQRRYGVFF